MSRDKNLDTLTTATRIANLGNTKGLNPKDREEYVNHFTLIFDALLKGLWGEDTHNQVAAMANNLTLTGWYLKLPEITDDGLAMNAVLHNIRLNFAKTGVWETTPHDLSNIDALIHNVSQYAEHIFTKQAIKYAADAHHKWLVDLGHQPGNTIKPLLVEHKHLLP